MKTLPVALIERDELNLRQGIKSSLSNIRSIVAMLYAIYLAEDKKAIVRYSQEYSQNGNTKIKLNDELRRKLNTLFPTISNESIDRVPIFISQMEALQVGIELFLKFGKITFVDGHSDSSERTGGNRFNKVIKFGTNIKLIDLLFSAYSSSQKEDLLYSWINNTDPEDNVISNRLKDMLTIFSEETQFKIRTNTGEISFQQEGIYKKLVENNTVDGNDIREFVGPYRIFKSYIKENLHPYIKDDGTNEFALKTSLSEEFKNYQQLVSNGLDIIPKRTTLTQIEVSNSKEEDILIIDKKSRSYSMEELGQILKSMYNSAEDKKKVLSIHMFGIKYGEEIRKNGYTAPSIIKASGLNESYVTELSKALNIYESINTNSFGVRFDSTMRLQRPNGENPCLQQIFYGAPGTGKSHIVKQITKGQNKTVVTFHPDTDYSSFVGSYKPTMHEDGKTITYDFVPQAFANAYVNAWEDTSKDYYLVIEEINRGNCAQIFGDVFQLLDRCADGFSDYVIDVDKDFAGYIEKKLSKIDGYKEKITELAEAADIAGNFSFAKIALPANLHIIATMNTSDQSLFPMDSAFKRRWDWIYIPIEPKSVEHACVKIKDREYSWSSFITKVNKKISSATESEDKQIGNHFIKIVIDKNKSIQGRFDIEAVKFRSKVMFYLWFEVFKDASNIDTVFAYNEGDKVESFTFTRLFEDGWEDVLIKFMDELKVSNYSYKVKESISEEIDEQAESEVAN